MINCSIVFIINVLCSISIQSKVYVRRLDIEELICYTGNKIEEWRPGWICKTGMLVILVILANKDCSRN